MKKRKSIIALLLIAIIGIVGLTIAYFANSTDVENTFTTKEYGTEYTEEFVSPDNWLPGDTAEKTLVANNTGEVDQAVRIHVSEAWTTRNGGTLNGWIHADGTKSNHTTEEELATDEKVAILNLANTSDWTKVGDYYYYNYKLAPGESTSSFLESVTFNSKTKLDDTCTETVNNGVRTVTCNSSGDDYDNATYTLTFTIETVQYNKYASAWNTNYEIFQMSKYEDFEANGLPVNSIASTYNTQTKRNMFVFNHAATEQTGALTDYRYIGNDPYNYVYFNCDDLDNQSSSTCEIWRILGVFDVDDGTGNIEQRIKLVRGSSFSSRKVWNSSYNNNDWTNATLKQFLNGDYYNRTGDAESYGLKVSAQNMIGDAEYYLGTSNVLTGTAEDIYIWERGNVPCATCNSNLTKLNWIGKVALMYPSDEYMVYGKGVSATCYDTPEQCELSVPANTGWIYNTNVSEGSSGAPFLTWFLSPTSTNNDRAFCSNGVAQYSSWYGFGYRAVWADGAVRPVVYLKSSVEIDSGTGTSSDPYVLKNNNN